MPGRLRHARFPASITITLRLARWVQTAATTHETSRAFDSFRAGGQHADAAQHRAVGRAPHRLRQAADLLARGCKLKTLADSAECAAAIVDFVHAGDATFEVWIEIDSDGHRGGVRPESDERLAIGKLLHAGGATFGGVMTHAGASYELNTRDALEAMAEQERRLCVLAAQQL